MNNTKLAILIACYNRRDITLACLDALHLQDLTFDVYLTDDGSTDGTSEAVKAYYPEVNILQGNGNLFWGGGTRLAFAEALKADYDYYIWLNDDTLLNPNALSTLLNTHQKLALRDNSKSIVVGSMQDPVTEKNSYGGYVKDSWRPLKFKLLKPTPEPQECETINGNLVLIPRSVAAIVGNIDEAFRHMLGDFDYGLRARKLGCLVYIAPGYLGTCSQNNIQGTWMDTNLSLKQRLRKFNFKGSSLLRPDSWLYARRHGGALWLVYWLRPYIQFVYITLFKRRSLSSISLNILRKKQLF